MSCIIVLRGRSKFIESDLAPVHLEAGQHLERGLNHPGRAAEVVFDARGIGMLDEVIIPQNLVDETGVGLPVVFGTRFR